MKTDIEIAKECKLKRIDEIAEGLGIPEEKLIPYGKYMAKIPLQLIDEKKLTSNKLILVTAITPNKAGIGKTTVSIGLAMALNRLGKKAVVALREPSLGPCFGMKGGAAGGGYSQVVPMENINLHFTGDFHAVTTAHNMISALLDNYLYRNRKRGFGLKEILWKRVTDINDRSLREIVSGLGPSTNGIPAQSGFDITPASEIMAILCLAENTEELKKRIGNILLGYTLDGKTFKVKDMKIEGAIAVLLKDALNPNLVQTLENTPAIVHGGPFANIAHGCNSVIATKTAMSLGDYTVTEAGFGADLGAEKFYNIKCRKAGINPRLTVLVASLQALKLHGGADSSDRKLPDETALRKGFANLDKHISNIENFGQNVIVTCNRFAGDTQKEMDILKEHCRSMGIPFAENSCFAEGGKGSLQLARLVSDTIEKHPSGKLEFTYRETDSVREKIEKIARNIYGAGKVEFSTKAEKMLVHIKDSGIDTYPVCIAKTQYSFTCDAGIPGIRNGFDFRINDIAIDNGAGFIVAIAGDIMRMPGLPENPQALKIDLIDGEIVELS